MNRIPSIPALLMVLLVAPLAWPVAAAEAAAGEEGETVSEEELLGGPDAAIELPAPGDRRDIFFSLVDVLNAERELAELEEEQRAGEGDDAIRTAPEVVPDPDADDTDRGDEALEDVDEILVDGEDVPLLEVRELEIDGPVSTD